MRNLRAVGPWKESLTEGVTGHGVQGDPATTLSSLGSHETPSAPSVNDPVFALVAEALEASAKAMEELAHVLRSDARRVRKLG
jgi:hypothetical protein